MTLPSKGSASWRPAYRQIRGRVWCLRGENGSVQSSCGGVFLSGFWDGSVNSRLASLKRKKELSASYLFSSHIKYSPQTARLSHPSYDTFRMRFTLTGKDMHILPVILFSALTHTIAINFVRSHRIGSSDVATLKTCLRVYLQTFSVCPSCSRYSSAMSASLLTGLAWRD